MKFLDLNGLKHLLGKVVKYDKGTSNVSGINNLSVNKIGASDYTSASIIFSATDTDNIKFKTGNMQIEFSSMEDVGLHLVSYPLIESAYPEEFNTLKYTDLFWTIANILHTLKEKGIMQ